MHRIRNRRAILVQEKSASKSGFRVLIRYDRLFWRGTVSGQLDALSRHIRRLAGTQVTTRDHDSHLLERYVCSKDEAAFTALVERHGGLVWSVCRNVLEQQEDAEDAFQAV